MKFRRRKAQENIAPLCVQCTRRVRFEEVDQLRIMWHGRYASWFEDGRDALGFAYGLHYLDFYEHGISIPLKLLHSDFCKPLLYSETYTITTSLLWNDAALLDIEYLITDAKKNIMTKAFTTQLMLDAKGNLILEQPPFFRALRQQWAQGNLTPRTLTPIDGDTTCA